MERNVEVSPISCSLSSLCRVQGIRSLRKGQRRGESRFWPKTRPSPYFRQKGNSRSLCKEREHPSAGTLVAPTSACQLSPLRVPVEAPVSPSAVTLGQPAVSGRIRPGSVPTSFDGPRTSRQLCPHGPVICRAPSFQKFRPVGGLKIHVHL